MNLRKTLGVFPLLAALAWPIAAQETEVIWDGGAGEWDEAFWNDGQTAEEVLGSRDGSNGIKSPNGGETIIIRGDDSKVTYDANFIGSDFRIKQGSSLVIADGAEWVQPTMADWSENRWTQMDLSNLVLDGGTYARTGSVPGEGGGAAIFGSWRGDDNFDNENTPPPQTINIDILNGGRLENEGQLWFGGWEDHAAGLTINMTINDGTLDLTGGNVEGVGDEADADWVFIFDIDEDGRFTEEPGDPKEEQYSVNFVGPGSITVDESGIIAPVKEDFGAAGLIWNELDPITYEQLWALGILQAHGQSGADGANFADFFTVEGDLGSNNYRLTSMVEPIASLDCNGDGVVDFNDVLCAKEAGQLDELLDELGLLKGDLNGMDGVDFTDFLILSVNFDQEGTYLDGDIDCNGRVDFADFLVLSVNFDQGGAGASSVPEPTGLVLLGLGGLLALARRQRRRILIS